MAKSRVLRAAKRGENLKLDPSLIPTTQGEITNIGDILLKDANTTHRGNYLRYLRSEVLPSTTQAFDVKLAHKDPSGAKVFMLTIRCGKHVATEVVRILSTSLNGEGTNPEIFISRLALGANRHTKGEHEKIYRVHHDYLSDISRLPSPACRAVDTAVIEHLDSGVQIMRTPRQWAKNFTFPDGTTSLEADLENGT